MGDSMEIAPASSTLTLACWLSAQRTRIACLITSILNRLGLPGFIRPLQYHDMVTGNDIEVRVGVLFTIVRVNNRDYWFERWSGRFDGTGMALYQAALDPPPKQGPA